MKIKKLVFLGLLPLFLSYASVIYAEKWLPISVKEFTNFAIDESSIEIYPGSVSFITKFRNETLDIYHKSIFLCGSSEIYGIVGKIILRGEPKPTLSSDISDRGIREKYNSIVLKNYLSKKCGSQISKDELEIPITLTSEEANFILAKSSKLSRRFVVLWEKSYPSEKQDIVISGEKVIVDGKPLWTTKVFTDKGYSLNSFQYDCDIGTFEALSMIKYDGYGKVKESYDFSSSKSAPKRLVPGSIGMTTFDFACGLRK